MKVIINKDAKIHELAEIIVKLRHTTKVWQVGYGHVLLLRKKLWEQKADEWIENNVKEIYE